MGISRFASSALVIALGIAFLGGCATVQDTARDDNIDTAKVAAIDNAAKVTGVTVKWINYPQKRSRAVGVAPAMPASAGT